MRIWGHQTDNIPGKLTDCIPEDGAITAEGLKHSTSYETLASLRDMWKYFTASQPQKALGLSCRENFQIFTENKITIRVLRRITFPVLWMFLFVYAVFLAPHYMDPPDLRAESKFRLDRDCFWWTQRNRGHQNSVEGILWGDADLIS